MYYNSFSATFEVVRPLWPTSGRCISARRCIFIAPHRGFFKSSSSATLFEQRHGHHHGSDDSNCSCAQRLLISVTFSAKGCVSTTHAFQFFRDGPAKRHFLTCSSFSTPLLQKAFASKRHFPLCFVIISAGGRKPTLFKNADSEIESRISAATA